MSPRRDAFTTIRSEGALLPPDFLQRIAAGDKDVEGLSPESYHLPPREKLSEAITRSWNRLLGFWSAFQAATGSLMETDAGTSPTREKWLLPLFQELGYGRLPAGKGFEIEGKSYPISHTWQNTPIHLLGRNVELDRPTKGVAGAARHSPHGLVQEFLNRHEGHLWGFLSNGLKLRILRDNKSLTRQAYVEFDLAAMMDGQVYSDFAVLWLLCHQSRVEAEKAEQCWLEKWTEAARERGTRALDTLRDGVEKAIAALGRGFLAHPANGDLRDRLREGQLDKQDYYRQLLRTVYRLIFLCVAEDRDLLLTSPPASRERKRYLEHYSAQRLRRLAEQRRGSPHPDLWQTLRLVFAKLSSETGCPELALPALGSFLWSDKATPDLDRCELANTDLLTAIRSMAFTLDGKVRRTIDYRNLGAEELGSVYESLLELHPEVNAEAPTFELTTAPGHERKKTGSYYTPTSLIECLLDSALDPVLDEAAKQPDSEKAILDLKVCDPACGSGHFLIAAAHRMANRLAAVRTGDEEPSPEAVRKALRDIVGRCLYGVDINPMAVELCKVNLWLEALEPGKPLSFLEHHIQCGNSLLGATPELLKKGIPDEAFEPLEGDDKAICRIFKRKNKAEREGGQTSLLETLHEGQAPDDLAKAIADLDAVPDDTPEGQRSKQARWEELVRSKSYESNRLLADAWCAAFVWKKVEDPNLPYAITESTFQRIEKEATSAPEWMRQEIDRLAAQYQFLHWHLAFPGVLGFSPESKESGPERRRGFHVIVGNPPWGAETAERVKPLTRIRFATVAHGTVESSAAFTELASAVAMRERMVGLALPDILLLKNYPQFRQYLLQRTTIIQIAHWGQAFPDASIDVCTIAFRTGGPGGDHLIDTVPSVGSGGPTASMHAAVPQRAFLANKDYRFNLRLTPQTTRLIEAMKQLGPRVGALFTIREGVHSGNVRARLFLDHPIGDRCEPLIFGRDEIQPMQLRWKGKYIQLDPHHFNREEGDYFNLGDPLLYVKPKILVRRTGDFLLAAPDFDGRYCSNNFFILVPRVDMPRCRLLYVAAALNSQFATLYFRTIQPRSGRLFAELKITHLEEIPIPFFGDAVADAGARRLLESDSDPESAPERLACFLADLDQRLRAASPDVASLMESQHAR